jgi:hypothetical protein
MPESSRLIPAFFMQKPACHIIPNYTSLAVSTTPKLQHMVSFNDRHTISGASGGKYFFNKKQSFLLIIINSPFFFQKPNKHITCSCRLYSPKIKICKAIFFKAETFNFFLLFLRPDDRVAVISANF